ncbi:AAA domain-containing protein [Kocuria sp.]|uniref:AAA domain-containing protein n=1 Tax=Kocuria sp. TaxID=1871328 RepID=UPI0026DFB57A|nr:AAA domain-containing protein [Kocuria sp.]MDO5619432.1 AAA domain-containing protein [Kocuria sp.]
MADLQTWLIRVKRDSQHGSEAFWRDETSQLEVVSKHDTYVVLRNLKTQRQWRQPSGTYECFGDGRPVPVPAGKRLRIRGSVWNSGPVAVAFGSDGPSQELDGARLLRIFWTTKAGEQKSGVYETTDVEIVTDIAQVEGPSQILEYWHRTAELLEGKPDSHDGRLRDNPTRLAYQKFNWVDENSALACYLNGFLGESTWIPRPVILPFQSNEDQRMAVERALRNRVSVIKGPPGTGKTETILNIIANVILDPNQTVGVVSSGNSAVNNVQEKLVDEGFGFVTARLGNTNCVKKFVLDQKDRNLDLSRWLGEIKRQRADAVSSDADVTLAVPGLDELSKSEAALTDVWRYSRELAQIQREIAAYRLEKRHFDQSTIGDQLPDLDHYPLLKKSSSRIIEYLVDRTVHPDPPTGLSGLVKRIRDYFTYGRLKDLETGDGDTVLGLQRAFYVRRLQELEAQQAEIQRQLDGLGESATRAQHQKLSSEILRSALVSRYQGADRSEFSDPAVSSPKFQREYPVILSTCHSLRSNMGNDEYLLDWLIIDEATQVDLLISGLAMSRSRNVVIVGDLKQLGHITDKAVEKQPIVPPNDGYDVVRHNILSSVIEVYGANVPQTQLREHFRCPPAIIEFCNKMFYDGELIPIETRHEGAAREAEMLIFLLAPGNHARRLTHGNVKGTYNQREIEVIRDEVLTAQNVLDASLKNSASSGDGVADLDIGVASPYRLQANRLSVSLNAAEKTITHDAADTIHRYQGRGVKTMVLSTVIDESWVGRTGAKFVDDPRMVNVAVSRAKSKFIVVVHHDELPKTKYLSALVDYIRYQDPQQVVQSEILSVFDLLYAEYSERLNEFAAKIEKITPYDSENSVHAALVEVLCEDRFCHLSVVSQVRLKNLLPALDLLDDEQKRFVNTVASVDFAIYHRVTNRLVLTVEVDGFSFHENCPEQRVRDARKDSILATYNVPLLRLPTTGSREHQQIRDALDQIGA